VSHWQAVPGAASLSLITNGVRLDRQLDFRSSVGRRAHPADRIRATPGFTYTVLATATGEVIGCVYVYPPHGEGPNPEAGGGHATVSSWVRADHAALDPALYHAVRAWLERDWPFRSIEYAPRD
jgi:hypothetical protein